MTPEQEISLRDHFDERFDDLSEHIDLKIAVALAGYVRWRDIVLAITGVSTLVGLIFFIASKGSAG